MPPAYYGPTTLAKVQCATDGDGMSDDTAIFVGASDADGDPLNVTWDFGDGSATSSSGTHVYSTPGTFTATATISDGKKLRMS